jgi:hypothetical protein
VLNCSNNQWLTKDPSNNIIYSITDDSVCPTDAYGWSQQPVCGMWCTMFFCKLLIMSVVISNQRYFKIVCFCFPTNVLKISNIFVFEAKFTSKPKCLICLVSNYLFRPQKFLSCFRNLWNKSKNFGIVSSFWFK